MGNTDMLHSKYRAALWEIKICYIGNTEVLYGKYRCYIGNTEVFYGVLEKKGLFGRIKEYLLEKKITCFCLLENISIFLSKVVTLTLNAEMFCKSRGLIILT